MRNHWAFLGNLLARTIVLISAKLQYSTTHFQKYPDELIAPLGPRAICGGLMREVGRESVFKDADPRLVAGGGSSSSAAVGISRRPDARRQSP